MHVMRSWNGDVDVNKFVDVSISLGPSILLFTHPKRKAVTYELILREGP